MEGFATAVVCPEKLILQYCFKSGKLNIPPDVEIMVYLGILDTRKFMGLQKILTKITAILSQK